MSIRMFLIVDGVHTGISGRLGKMKREVRSIITQKILPNINFDVADELSPKHYPWCFVISSSALSRQSYCAGAFNLLPGKNGEQLLVVICSVVSWSWLQKNMCDERPLTFWAARILNLVREGDIAAENAQLLSRWFRTLKGAYSPWRQFILKPVWRFENQSEMLLREGAHQDYQISNCDGVEVMPWKNWPDCVQYEAGIWIWRQSRHSKILYSQRIHLRHARVNPADGSYL